MRFGLKKNIETFENIVDMHCHIIPAVDDGASNMEEALRMLKTAEEQGTTHIVCTPHYKNHHKTLGGEKLREVFENLKKEAQRSGLGVKLYLGNEVFYFQELEKAVDEAEIATMNGTSYLLVEFHPDIAWQKLWSNLYDVRSYGLKPVLAHAERYKCLLGNPSNMEDLKSLGVKIQINAASVTGELGIGIKRYVKKLLKYEMVDYISTDAHDDLVRAPKIQECESYLLKKYDRSYVEGILYKNAMKDFQL